jgi:hypothetical protein
MIRSILNTFICMAMNQAASQAAASRISNSSSTLFSQSDAPQPPYLPWSVPMALPAQNRFPLNKAFSDKK